MNCRPTREELEVTNLSLCTELEIVIYARIIPMADHSGRAV
jgi:hypothetical protein